jgi:hypothetical protein
MSVIISDFEIIPDSSGSDEGSDDGSQAEWSQATDPSIRPIDVEQILARDRRRRHRLRAH